MDKGRGQHFLLSAKARSFSLLEIFRLSDEQAFDLFKLCRWPETNGDAVCPQCGSLTSYWIKTRKQWRCKDCNRTYSVTSGTIFANHKLPLRTYLAAIALYSNAAKGISALQVSRDLDVQYKTAFVLMHKLRESLTDSEQVQLSGQVEIDAAYVNAHVRPQNRIENRPDRRFAKNQSPNKRAVTVLRQRGPKGAEKTLTFLSVKENQQDARLIARRHIVRGSTVFADEHSAYDVLHADFDTIRVNHSSIYVGPYGENTNQAESYFSRFRRMQYGHHHKMNNTYILRYANEVAYREDTRRQSNGEIFKDIAGRCARRGVSRDFCGYWQGNKKRTEDMVR